jgi:hypothetical protein
MKITQNEVGQRHDISKRTGVYQRATPRLQALFFMLMCIRASRAKQLGDLVNRTDKKGADPLVPFFCKMQSMTNDGARLIFIFTLFYHL